MFISLFEILDTAHQCIVEPTNATQIYVFSNTFLSLTWFQRCPVPLPENYELAIHSREKYVVLCVVRLMFVADNTATNATIFLVKLQQVAKIRFVATCYLQIVLQLVKTTCNKPVDNKLWHPTCNKFVDNSQTMQTYADIGFFIKNLLQDVNRFFASWLSNLVIHRFVASCFNKLKQVFKRQIESVVITCAFLAVFAPNSTLI